MRKQMARRQTNLGQARPEAWLTDRQGPEVADAAREAGVLLQAAQARVPGQREWASCRRIGEIGLHRIVAADVQVVLAEPGHVRHHVALQDRAQGKRRQVQILFDVRKTVQRQQA